MDQRRSIVFLVIAMVLTIVLQVELWPHITDDSYITFRYAHHAATGQGLVFNSGEQVEGFSNPLWTLLLAGATFATGFTIPDIARTIGLILALATLVLLERILAGHPTESGPPPSLWGLLLVSAAPGFHVFATAGLEGPLLSFLLILGTFLSLRNSSSTRTGAALAFGLAGITRPEGPLYALFWFLITTRPFKKYAEAIRNEWSRFVVMIIPMLAWQIFRAFYYGAWLPNTAVAKVPGVFGEFIGFSEYITPWVIALGGPLLLLLWTALPSRIERARKLERIALAVGGANLIFIVYAQGDWMTFGRFIVPVLPVLAAAFAVWIHAGWEWLRRANLVRAGARFAYLPAAGILACSYFAWYPSIESYAKNEQMNMLMRGDDQLAVGRWIADNISPKATIATGRLGGISYGAIENVVWDWFGLTDAEEAEYIRKGRPGTIDDDPVFRRNPDVIAAIEAPADWSYKRTTQLVEYLEKDYVFILGFPQGTYGYVDIWMRTDRLEEMFVKRDDYIISLPRTE